MVQEEKIGLIAGNGNFPLVFTKEAKNFGVKEIVAVAFQNETSPKIEKYADCVTWIKIGELNKLIKAFQSKNITKAVMAGQITPTSMFKNMKFDLRMIALLAKIKNRKADTIFGAIAQELKKEGIVLDDSTKYLRSLLAQEGLLTKKKPSAQEMKNIEFGKKIAKEIGRLDIGQTVVIKEKAILAVEAFEGTNETIERGGRLGKQDVIVVKMSKPNQDMRFDVPVIGEKTLETLIKAKAKVLAIEADKTLVLDKEKVINLANKHSLTIIAIK